MAKKRNIKLRQSYSRLSRKMFIMQSRYARARQMKKAAKCTKKLKTWLGRVIRDIERKCSFPDQELKQALDTATRIYQQKRQDKNKVYSFHEPHVECISKGKAHKRYEFGTKVSLGVSSRGGWILGALAFHGNPYDGHTLSKSLEQIEKISFRPDHVFADQGYRGHDYEGPVRSPCSQEETGKDTEEPIMDAKKGSNRASY